MDATTVESINSLIAFMKVFMVICGGITCIGGAVAVLSRWHDKAKAPEMSQNGRILALEIEMQNVKAMLERDNKRLMELENGMKAITKGLIAVLNANISGDNKEQMQDALTALNHYLIER